MPKTTQSLQYAAMVAASGNYAETTLLARVVSGPVQFARFDVPIDADSAALDVITLGELPPGAVVLPELSKILVTDDMTSGALTIDIGDAADPDRYCDGANCASVGSVDFMAPAVPAGFTTRYRIPAGANQLLTATLATFTATIESGSFSVIVAFKSY